MLLRDALKHVHSTRNRKIRAGALITGRIGSARTYYLIPTQPCIILRPQILVIKSTIGGTARTIKVTRASCDIPIVRPGKITLPDAPAPSISAANTLWAAAMPQTTQDVDFVTQPSISEGGVIFTPTSEMNALVISVPALSAGEEFEAILYIDELAYQPSVAVVYIPAPPDTVQVLISDPVFVPPAGTYSETQSVVLSTTTVPSGGTIYYTTDGTDPDEDSDIYTEAIDTSWDTPITIKVRAFMDGYLPSPIYSATYDAPPDTVQVLISDPVFVPPAGTYSDTQNVVLSTTTEPSGGTIYYTTDGTDPTTNSAQYTTPIMVSETTTIKVFAHKDGYNDSPISTAVYTIGDITEDVFAWNAEHVAAWNDTDAIKINNILDGE